MSSFVDILQGFANEFVKLRDRVDELERLETYYGVLDLNGYTLTLSNDVTLVGNPPSASAKYIVQTADASLSGEQALDSLATGLLKNNGATGVLSIATAGTDYAAASHNHAASDITSGTVAPTRLGSGTASATTILHGDNTWSAVDIVAETTGTLTIARGGTGATSASAALSALGAAAASHTHAAADVTTGTMATARLGSGTASATTILHGDSTWSAVDILAETTGTLSVTRGGTGATTASAALAALGGISGSGTSGQVTLFNGTGSVTSDNGLTFNTTNNDLTVGRHVLAGGEFSTTGGSLTTAGGISLNITGNYVSGTFPQTGYVTMVINNTARRFMVG